MGKLRFVLFLVLALVTASSYALARAHELEFKTYLNSANEVPARVSPASGEFEAELSEDGTELYYKLELEEIRNTVAAHIHLGGPTVNGPVVAFLYGPEAPGSGFSKKIVVSGVITAADLTGPLAGQPLSVLIEQMVAGNIYVNAHTNDGVGAVNTGAGDFAAGEIRGQIQIKD